MAFFNTYVMCHIMLYLYFIYLQFAKRLVLMFNIHYFLITLTPYI